MDRQDKLLGLFGLAKRAGRLEAGFDASSAAARSGRSAMLAAAQDISEKTWKNLSYEAQRAKIPALRVPRSMEVLGRACGVRAGIVSVNDKGFAGAILKALDREQTDLTDDHSDPVGIEKEEDII